MSVSTPDSNTDVALAADPAVPSPNDPIDPLADLDASRLRTLLADTHRELDTFLHTVSHDLREPLRSLEGFSMALVEDYGAMLEGDGALYLSRLRGAVHRLGDRLDALLNLARLNRQPLNITEVDLSVAFAEALAQLGREQPLRAVEVSVAPGLWVKADPDLMKTMVSHLAHNAWKFSRERHPARITVDRDSLTGAVRIADNGAGFDMRYSERIFAPFGRFHADREFEGQGFGLSIVQRIVLRHGGRIWVNAEVDRGATVCIDLSSGS